MLDPWIIDEILRREEEKRQEQERQRIEAPIAPPRYRDSDPKLPVKPNDEGERGVVVIDI